ncbi:MAG: metallophosphoesterase [Verrucomicrobiota bacterium]
MKRRQFIGTLAAGTGGLVTVLAQERASTEKPLLVSTPMVLMAPRMDGIEAVWAVSRLSRGLVEWEAEDGAKGLVGADAFGFVPQGDRILRVRLSGLKPGTACRVRAHTIAADDKETVVSAWKTFRPLNPGAVETRFVMWNDTHIHDESIRALHEVTPTADFLLWNGDTCNDWTQDELLVPTLLHPGQCDITEQRPLFITWGNHDVRGAHAFKMPGLVATPDGRPFYAFRSGPVAVICLHTGEDKPDDHPTFQGRVAFDALRAEQTRWLAETIRRPELRSAPYRVVACHIPLRWKDERAQDYSNQGFDRHSGRSRAAWHSLLVEWNTQVILSGHTHQPTWLPPTDEFPYGQLIGGGPQLPQATWTEGVADARQFRLKVRNLEGKTLHDVTFTPLT